MIASLGGIAAMVVAIAWAFLAAIIVFVLFTVSRVIEATRMMIDGVRQETVPLIAEVRTTVQGVNKELDRADTMVQSVGNIVKSAERMVAVVEQTVSSPLIKVVAFSAGASRAVGRFRKKKD